MKKILIDSWEELVSLLPDIGTDKDEFQKTSPKKQKYNWEEHESLIQDGEWMKNKGNEENEKVNSKNNTNNISTPTGWFGSFYIGPTSDAVMKAMPIPAHAADYIAQQHDLEYQELGLNGIGGTLDPRSSEADRRLIMRCNELIQNYEQGIKNYHGYEITPQAYQAALYMKEYFIVEESISDFIHKM